MSSSPPSLLSSVASCESRSPSSPPSHGSPTVAARVHHLPSPSRSRLQDLHIGGADASASASAAQKPSTPFASLNPLAREFVPTVSPPNEGSLAKMESSEGGSTDDLSCNFPLPPQDGGDRVSGAFVEENDRKGLEYSQGKGTRRRSGGLSTALKRGQTGQGRLVTVSRGGHGGTDNHGGTAIPSSQPLNTTAGLGKRAQFINANHLLNFQYDPIVRPPPVPRFASTRRAYKVQPFNKELFLQANFRFLVSDFGDYLLNSLDPDKMLQWEDIAAVNVSAPLPIQCPICLESPPVCPQITSCGHIFCFPCILRYLVLGEDQQRSDHFKKCPLCFAMTSSKALRTVFVDNVHNYQVGDTLELTLLNRSKGSIIPFQRSDGVAGALPYSKDGQCHSFSKFTLTSDADQITSRAISELSSWAERTQNEDGEDLDLLPFALLAIDLLQQRKSAWVDHRVAGFLTSSPPVRQRIMAQTKEVSQTLKLSAAENESKRGENIAAETQTAMADLKVKAAWVYENAFSDDEGVEFSKTRPRMLKGDCKETIQLGNGRDASSSWEDCINGFDKTDNASDVDKDPLQDIKKDDDDSECYAFYQSADGQPLILHPLNMKCLLQYHGSYEKLPSRVQVKILEMEGQIQSEVMRKRYRYLNHLPLTTNFWFCEVDLRGILPSSAFTSFIDELRHRENRRHRRLKQEQAERLREERISVAQSGNSPAESVEDSHEEELPSGLASDETNLELMLPSQGPLDQRKLFSQVTRLGFASAHDAPYLTIPKHAEPSTLSHEMASSSVGTSTGKPPTLSFADVIQSQPSKPALNAINGSNAPSQSSSKKNKKATKILLSTAGGRRY